MSLTAERLREVLAYDPETGLFVRLVDAGRNGKARAGAVAGSLDSEGYAVIKIDGKDYKAHRLVWLFVHGRWPAAQIDHINGQKADNRFSNLREASNAENGQNILAPQGNNTSGLRGVSWHKASGKWEARIMLAGKSQHLGHFTSEIAAFAAYAKARAAMHPYAPEQDAMTEQLEAFVNARHGDILR